MSHNWVFIFSLLSLPIVILGVYLVWRYFKHKHQQEQEQVQEHEGQQQQQSHTHIKLGQIDENEQKSEQRSIKIQPIIPRRVKKNDQETCKPIIKNRETLARVDDHFLKDFDERDKRRKLLQQENEVELSRLLKWKSPFEFYHSPASGEKKTVSDHKIFLPKLKPKPVTTQNKITPKEKLDQEKEWLKVEEHKIDKNYSTPSQAPKPSPRQKIRRRYSTADAGLSQNVTKVINFVAITSKEPAPEYKPRNKFKPTPPARRIDFPRRDKCSDKLRRKLVVRSCDLSFESHESEDIGDFEDFLMESDVASKSECDELESAEVQMIETQFYHEKSSVRTHSLKFSDNKRNMITERLFAGNIYVGNSNDSDEDLQTENISTNEDFSSWREKFKRKLSS